MNPVKRDANAFFKVLLLSAHLLISRHPVQKSKFGACAVTGYCSFKLPNVSGNGQLKKTKTMTPTSQYIKNLTHGYRLIATPQSRDPVLTRVLAGFNIRYYWYSEFANRKLAVIIQKTHLGLIKSVNPEVVTSR